MKNETEFLTAVYDRAAQKKRRIRRQRKSALLALLVLLIAAPSALAARQFLAREPVAQNDKSTANGSLENYTGALPENYTGAVNENATGAGVTEAPATTAARQLSFTVNCVPLPGAQASAMQDGMRGGPLLIRSAQELAQASGAIPDMETDFDAPDFFENYILLSVYLPGCDASSLTPKDLRVYVKADEICVELKDSAPAGEGALAVIQIERASAGDWNALSGVRVEPAEP